MITNFLYFLLGFAVILGMVISFFFFTATIFDLFLIFFPFLERSSLPRRKEYFNSLYGSPKICCAIVFSLSSAFFLLFKLSYPYLSELFRGVLS